MTDKNSNPIMEWRSKFEKLLNSSSVQQLGEKSSKLFRLSESPIGFAMIAAIGLTVLILVKVSSSQSENTTSPNTAIMAIDEKNAEVSVTSSKTDQSNIVEEEEQKLDPIEEIFTLRRNETLIDLLVKRNKINRSNAHAAVNAIGTIADLRKLRTDQAIRLTKHVDDNHKLQSLKLRTAFEEEATVSWNNTNFVASKTDIGLMTVTKLVESEINDSLYLSAKAAGASDKIIIDLIRLMSFDVDFQRDIRKGDKFSIYYQRSFAPEFNDVREDEIISASLTLRGNQLDAIAFTASDGEQGYYDANGRSTQKALMKTPVEGARLSSRFGRRKHPILGYTRLHKGLDFAAPRGTPIMAAGNGTIEMATRNGSFGNYIRIRHGNSYKTAYAHLKSYARGIKKGRKVKQGQIIGYIGTTGRSTGPHLHYEVLLSGKQINPQTLKLPTSRVLKAIDLTTFENRHKAILAEVEQIKYYAEIEKQFDLARNENSDFLRAQVEAN
jgi:murein DD-endopeptidase MepM/ murein hydrolase activator NlpD